MNGDAVAFTGLVLAVAACVAGSLRWLRVAQREHYLPGSASVFARRWWTSRPLDVGALVLGAAGTVASFWVLPCAFAGVVVAAAGPAGLGVRGRTAKLSWTPRLRRLAVLLGVAMAVVLGAGAAVAGGRGAFRAGAFASLLVPLLVDIALLGAKPLEARRLAPFVEQASRRLASVGPRVVAITGSYGKTTTKGYVAHLLSGRMSVLATPASFNNTPGLARAINEHLSSGTDVFVAEMGTYGRGEIASMCEWVVPEVSVITAIGPVHLERMRSLENIALAKSEILDKARVAVLNVDYPLLAALADEVAAAGKAVWRCSSAPGGSVAPDAVAAPADARPPLSGGPPAPAMRGSGVPATVDVVARWEDGPGPEPKLRVQAGPGGHLLDVIVPVAPEVEPGNVACAVAAALSLGAPAEVVEARLGSLPGAPHRRTPQAGPSGVVVIDDTYNSNPAGARAALALLAKVGAPGGRRVVVTPGMVEMGRVQHRENVAFATRAAEVATDLLVVGRTNASALLEGAHVAGLATRRVSDRASAVAWVSANLGSGDAVLYENDLPDHYP